MLFCCLWVHRNFFLFSLNPKFSSRIKPCWFLTPWGVPFHWLSRSSSLEYRWLQKSLWAPHRRAQSDKSSLAGTLFPIYRESKRIEGEVTGQKTYFFFSSFLCVLPSFYLSLCLLTTPILQPHLFFKPYLLGPDCIVHTYSAFPRSNLWMLFHHPCCSPISS